MIGSIHDLTIIYPEETQEVEEFVKIFTNNYKKPLKFNTNLKTCSIKEISEISIYSYIIVRSFSVIHKSSTRDTRVLKNIPAWLPNSINKKKFHCCI